ncbi:MAG: DUF3784 domain-containing protein [Flavobacteriales bacterium]
MYFLIAGYNTMPKEEKEKYKIEEIASLFFNVMLGMALIIIIGWILETQFFMKQFQFYSLILAIVLGVPYLLIKTNSKKYKK